jgi:hypothetical protein
VLFRLADLVTRKRKSPAAGRRLGLVELKGKDQTLPIQAERSARVNSYIPSNIS